MADNMASLPGVLIKGSSLNFEFHEKDQDPNRPDAYRWRWYRTVVNGVIAAKSMGWFKTREDAAKDAEEFARLIASHARTAEMP